MRPQFLTVLCILTFVSCAIDFYNGITTIASADFVASTTQEVMGETADKIKESGGANFVEKIMNSVSAGMTAENIRKLGISKLIYAVLTLLGAWLMFRLQKQGFYVYVAGVIAGFLIPIIWVGGIVGIGSSGGVFFSIIFTILYALNLKYLR
ncbi:hypothetical protein BLX24_18300 [Arsenicibacter rosenii]|uniref:DUF4064 domain-containing protein n=1 Tax=Arsenicibacter rosenii TaxID=1750698 RepID=A0A1S2VGC3_9BACT|nr:hypothetical protein BLX24_18300 [Arsenicibacter rosenii]